MSLEIKNIGKKYNNQDALKNVSFSLKKGDIVGFLGPNGAGKTTLMKIITSTLKQDSGDVFIFGKNTLKDEITTKNDIGYLAENNPLYKGMKVNEYLDFIASLYKIREKKSVILDIISKTGLSNEKTKKIEQLSKGYKQRVGIAASLIHNPKVLILDEPTTGLDPNQYPTLTRGGIVRQGLFADPKEATASLGSVSVTGNIGINVSISLNEATASTGAVTS